MGERNETNLARIKNLGEFLEIALVKSFKIADSQ